MRKARFGQAVVVPFTLSLIAALFAPSMVATQPVAAQPGSSDGEIRYRFAETYVGVEVTRWDEATLPAVSIGGTHFWGATDLYVRFLVGTVATEHGSFSPGIDTALHLYPVSLERNSIRPYIGAGWAVSSYQRPRGPVAVRHVFPIKAGVAWREGDHLLELGLTWLGENDFKYPVDASGRPVSTADEIPRLGIGVSYKYLFDTTLHAAPRYAADRAEERRLAAHGLLDSWGLILSPSTLFPAAQEALPAHLDSYPPAFTYEVGVSRYFYDRDLSLQVVYRPATLNQQAFDDEVRVLTHSLRVEGLQFLPLDYHGFVPYVGVGLGYEEWRQERSWASTDRSGGWAPALAFGWEIRPTGKESFYLRQSMRYAASRRAGAPVDTFDVSFIQLVYYWDR